MAGNHRGLVATVVTGVLAVSGVIVIAVFLTQQQHPRQPPLSASASPSPTTATGGAPTSRGPTPTSGPPGTPAATPGVIGPVLPASAPLSIAIPAIGVQSPLLRLGLTAQGALEVPAPGPDYNKAAWYRYSPTPGALGPAVIVGHVDSASQGPSVFYRLGSLSPGDKVWIRRADGSVAVFAVDEVRRYHKAYFPSQLVYGNTNHAALRLISCGGPFDPKTGHYLDNIIVLASLIRAGGSPPG